MIDLVLHTYCEQSLHVRLNFFAIAILVANADVAGSLNLFVVTWNRQTAFFGYGDTVFFENDWINQRVWVVAVGRNVEDEQPSVDVDLSRGESNAGSRVHGFK